MTRASESSRSSPMRVKSAGVIRNKRGSFVPHLLCPFHISAEIPSATLVLEEPGGPWSISEYRELFASAACAFRAIRPK